MSEKLSVSDNSFYVIMSDGLTVYAKEQDAVTDLRDELKTNENATIAQINYRQESDENGTGTFEVEPIGWKDIALGWVDAEEV